MTTTLPTTYDERLAKMAQGVASREANSVGGEFFTLSGGILKFGGNPVPGNQAGVVILDHIFENVYYSGKYDPNSPSAPMCYAFAVEENDLAPHPNVVQAGLSQHETCHGCPMNEWGTADLGRGKACRNTRCLALLQAGSFDQGGCGNIFDLTSDPEALSKAQVGFLKLPVTSVKPFAGYVQQLATSLKRPPVGVVSRVKVVPDAKTQFRVQIDAIMPVPSELIGVVLAKMEEVQAALRTPYPDYEEPAPAPVRQAPPPRRNAAPDTSAEAAPTGRPQPKPRRF